MAPRLLPLMAALVMLPAAALADSPNPPPAAPDSGWTAGHQTSHPLVGRLWDTASGTFISEADLIGRLTGARFVMLGEKHDNPDHHTLRARLVAGMVAAGRKPAVAFEMLDDSQAPALPGTDGAVLIAGNGHVRADAGAPWHLKRLSGVNTVLTVAMMEVSDDVTDPAEYGPRYWTSATPFDVLWFTPVIDTGDPCEAMRRHMEGAAQHSAEPPPIPEK